MFKLIFFVPKDNIEQVKNAIFEVGAGRIGNYAQCSWQTEGIGQFRPLDGAKPSIGNKGNLEVVPEIRVEILCLESNIQAAIEAMKQAHPYEEPAFEVISLQNHRFN
ncbi:MAG: hypothetical protein ACJAS4_003397 [Bacteriovoracaceae bacterium]|jgi:hypothetical protein